MRVKKVQLILFSILCALIVQCGLGISLVNISEVMWPRETHFVGVLGFIIIPHPLSIGLFILPITAVTIYFFTRSFLIRKGYF